MKRLLSWLVLILLNGVVGAMVSVLNSLAPIVANTISRANLLIQKILYPVEVIFGALPLVVAVCVPYLVVSVSNRIYVSQKGIRYTLTSAVMLLLYVLSGISALFGLGEFRYIFIVLIVYYVVLLYAGQKATEE